MDQNQVQNIEQQLYRDRGISFRGTARIRFAHLRFGNLSPREPNDKIIAYLKEKFSNEVCLQLEPKNHIPAVVSQKTLDACIRASPNVSQDLLLEHHEKQPSELKFLDNVMIVPTGIASNRGGKGLPSTQGLVVDDRFISRRYSSMLHSGCRL